MVDIEALVHPQVQHDHLDVLDIENTGTSTRRTARRTHNHIIFSTHIPPPNHPCTHSNAYALQYIPSVCGFFSSWCGDVLCFFSVVHFGWGRCAPPTQRTEKKTKTTQLRKKTHQSVGKAQGIRMKRNLTPRLLLVSVWLRAGTGLRPSTLRFAPTCRHRLRFIRTALAAQPIDFAQFGFRLFFTATRALSSLLCGR